MPVAWFICPYKRKDFLIEVIPGSGLYVKRPLRYCAMDDYTPEIYGEGGQWTESEVLGNCAVVKIRASDAVIAKVASDVTFTRIPLRLLTESMGTLSSAQRTAIYNKILALGYTAAEVRSALGNNLANRTLGAVLRFVASRRLDPRYDKDTDTIICDGAERTPRPIESVDAEVTE